MRGRRTRVVVGAAAALAAAGVVAAYAAIPDSGNVIHGCYQKENGQLRVIDKDRGQSCRPSERALSWNQKGPAGPPGPPGAGSIATGSIDTGFSSQFRPPRPVLQIPGIGAVEATGCEAFTQNETGGGARMTFTNDTPSVERFAQTVAPSVGDGTGLNLAPNQGATLLFTFSNGQNPSGTQVSHVRNVGSGRQSTLTASVVMDGQGCHFYVQAISS